MSSIPAPAAPRVPNTLSTMRAMVGRRIQYETKGGTIRSGRLTALRSHTIRLGGNAYEIPLELVCDGDETDATLIWDVIRIDVLPAAG